MHSFFQRLPFLVELIFNGALILLYTLKNTENIPSAWSPEVVSEILTVMASLAPLIVFQFIAFNFNVSKGIIDFIRKHLFSLIIFVPLLIVWGDVEFTYWLVIVHLISSFLNLYDFEMEIIKKSSLGRPAFLGSMKLKPSQIVLFSFVLLILTGTFLLMLPFSYVESSFEKLVEIGSSPSLVQIRHIPFIDAIFMATSATCVTGLSTISLSENFTTFGQIVILILIQIGGLGIMTLSSSMMILMGRSMGVKDRVVMQDLLNISSMEDLIDLIIDIIKYTFFIELWGAIILTIAFIMEDYELGQAMYYGFFHSISAFCNAGFSLFDTSLESFSNKPLIHGTIAVLVTLGGFGFIVLRELKEVVLKKKSLVRITLHTKIVLTISFVLFIGGFLFIFFAEFMNALDSFTIWEKIQVAAFQSVTLRTAGFSTIPLSGLHVYTIYIMALFMFIGASPGSTGGGIKTTTLAILFASIKSTLKSRKKVTLWDRNISGPMVVRATALTFISILTACFFILFLIKMDPEQSFLNIFFEVISAFGTVGLSLGITAQLSMMGKIGITVLMLIGRIGPLTLVLAIGEQRRARGRYDYPEGRLMIG